VPTADDEKIGSVEQVMCLYGFISELSRRKPAHHRGELIAIPSNDQLRTIQELRSIQEGLGEVGAIKHRLEKVRAVQMGTRQVRSAQVRSSEIGALQINSGKIEAAQVEASQTGPR